MSATYRQSSMAPPALMTRDPDNRLLAHQARFRLPAELIRDSALAVSGLLYPAIGGKSVRPPLPDPAAVKVFASTWRESTGPDRYRRGLYISVPANFAVPDAGQLRYAQQLRTALPPRPLHLAAAGAESSERSRHFSKRRRRLPFAC